MSHVVFSSVMLILYCMWPWLWSVCDIFIRALWHNPPPHHNHDKTHSRGGPWCRGPPVWWKVCGYELCNWALRPFTHWQAIQWHRRPLCLFSKQKGESTMNSGCLGWIKANLSACHNVRLLWPGTCLVRMVGSHTVVQLQRSGCSTQSMGGLAELLPCKCLHPQPCTTCT